MGTALLERPETSDTTAGPDDLTHEPFCDAGCYPHERMCGIPTAISVEAPRDEAATCNTCRALLALALVFGLNCAAVRRLR